MKNLPRIFLLLMFSMVIVGAYASADNTAFTKFSTISPVPVTDGGTGETSLIDHGFLVGSGLDEATALTTGTNGQLLIGLTVI